MLKRTFTFTGWILRKWTETSEHGWTAALDYYDTFEKALKGGQLHNKNLCINELSRDFEIYKNFKEEFVEV